MGQRHNQQTPEAKRSEATTAGGAPSVDASAGSGPALTPVVRGRDEDEIPLRPTPRDPGDTYRTGAIEAFARELSDEEFARVLAVREARTGQKLGKRPTGKYLTRTAIKIVVDGKRTRIPAGQVVDLDPADAKNFVRCKAVEPELA